MPDNGYCRTGTRPLPGSADVHDGLGSNAGERLRAGALDRVRRHLDSKRSPATDILGVLDDVHGGLRAIACRWHRLDAAVLSPELGGSGRDVDRIWIVSGSVVGGRAAIRVDGNAGLDSTPTAVGASLAARRANDRWPWCRSWPSTVALVSDRSVAAGLGSGRDCAARGVASATGGEARGRRCCLVLRRRNRHVWHVGAGAPCLGPSIPPLHRTGSVPANRDRNCLLVAMAATCGPSSRGGAVGADSFSRRGLLSLTRARKLANSRRCSRGRSGAGRRRRRLRLDPAV